MGALIDLLLGLGAAAIKVLVPELVQLISDWRDGKVTEQQAGDAFARMLTKLKDPHADGAATNAAMDDEAHKKFGG